MIIYRFKAQALTPIHVGSGCEIDPTEFMTYENRLIYFNPSQVLSELREEELNRYLQLLEKADLKGIQSFLRTHFDVGRHGIAQVDASSAFLKEFAAKASNPNNQFRVDMMPRNPHSGQVYLPGSSIKGAIRTAVVNHFANIEKSTRLTVHDAMRDRPVLGKAKSLEEEALGRRQNQTERDVFRLIDIEDVWLPSAATRIDRATIFNPHKKGAEKIQNWLERIKARCDTTEPPAFNITLHFDDRAMQHGSVQSLLGRTVDFDTLFSACNQFYWKRMQTEGDKFDGKALNGAGWEALYDLFPKGKTPQGQIVTIEPSKPYWVTKARKRMLLRVGRFSHFESLSVDELRQGYNIQARKPIFDMGSTRTRCLMENGKPPMPFGWLLLTLETA